jgi:hypothetical protein
MAHDHNEDCGHDEATHKRLRAKLDNFLEEMADEMFSEKDLTNLYSIITSKLRESKLGTTLPYLKAFNDGFEFGIYASNNAPDAISLCAGMKRISKLKAEEIKTLAARATNQEESNQEDYD